MLNRSAIYVSDGGLSPLDSIGGGRNVDELGFGGLTGHFDPMRHPLICRQLQHFRHFCRVTEKMAVNDYSAGIGPRRAMTDGISKRISAGFGGLSPTKNGASIGCRGPVWLQAMVSRRSGDGLGCKPLREYGDSGQEKKCGGKDHLALF